LEGQRLAGLADEGDVDHRLRPVGGGGAADLLVADMAVDGDVLPEQVELDQLRFGGDHERPDLPLAVAAGGQGRQHPAGEADRAVGDVGDGGAGWRPDVGRHAFDVGQTGETHSQVEVVDQHVGH